MHVRSPDTRPTANLYAEFQVSQVDRNRFVGLAGEWVSKLAIFERQWLGNDSSLFAFWHLGFWVVAAGFNTDSQNCECAGPACFECQGCKIRVSRSIVISSIGVISDTLSSQMWVYNVLFGSEVRRVMTELSDVSRSEFNGSRVKSPVSIFSNVISRRRSKPRT